MSNRNKYSHQRGRNYRDSTSTRHNTKYNQRGGSKNYRPESTRRTNNRDDVDTLMESIDRHLTTDGNSSQQFTSTNRTVNYSKNPRLPKRRNNNNNNSSNSQINWWRITINDVATIGKERVMTAVQARCLRPFQPYHYFVESRTKAGVFFVNNSDDADMIKRLNGKVEIQNLDILRIVSCRVPAPIPSLDEDLLPHFKDYLVNRRFNQQTFQLDLSNLVQDEELSSLGIYPQLNKQAFIRDIIGIINKDLHMTRQIDLGSNNIMNLYEFRNLHLNNLVYLNFSSNQLKNVDDFDHLKQLPQLIHISIKNNPLILQNKQRINSFNDIISTIRQKLPQLQRIDDAELPPTIRFLTDIETITLPKSLPHCVPNDFQGFLANFIDSYFQLFDKSGRTELHSCYHDLCMFSLCVTTIEGSIVPIRQFKYGALIHESRNLLKIYDDNRIIRLLRYGKIDVLDFLRVKFPLTKHDGNSFHVDVISRANNRAIFTVNGLYREVDQNDNGPIRYFQRTFTCAQTVSGVLIIADHILLSNPTEAQILKMNRSSTTTTAPTINNDIQNQMIQKFAQQSGMNIEYSKLCLEQNNWNYDKAAEVFIDLRNKNQIPAVAFNKS